MEFNAQRHVAYQFLFDLDKVDRSLDKCFGYHFAKELEMHTCFFGVSPAMTRSLLVVVFVLVV